jgi:hypothetical protein
MTSEDDAQTLLSASVPIHDLDVACMIVRVNAIDALPVFRKILRTSRSS